MKLTNYLQRPEYVLRPTQIYRRIQRFFNESTNKFEDVLLPWNIKIAIRPQDVIGRSIWGMGIYDLSVTEVLWRLIDRAETTIDIGANIGYMTSIMAKRVEKKGSVYCFEPHPEIYEELSENIKNWQVSLGWHQIKARQIALSNKSGEGVLNIPANFNQNRGTATLFSSPEADHSQNHANPSSAYTVALSTLDELIENDRHIGVLKIDVEGHELEVLQGASGLIKSDRIRDIIFEEHTNYPSAVTLFLEEHGYTIFRIGKSFWKPLVKPPTTNQVNYLSYWEPPSCLATKDPSRVIKRMQKRGWNSLAGKDRS
jgi:FkbM family methyltransferase